MTDPREPPSPWRIARVVRQAVLAEFRHDSCIASTRVAIEVCRYWGQPAKAQAVKVQAFNAAAWGDRERLAGLPIEQWPPGAWSVGIEGKRGTHDGRWDGHLVALAGRWLIDPSLDQLARPQYGLLLRASAFQMPAHWQGRLADDEAGVITQADGTVILYEPLSDTSYRQSGNWSAKLPAIRRCTAAAIRTLAG